MRLPLEKIHVFVLMFFLLLSALAYGYVLRSLYALFIVLGVVLVILSTSRFKLKNKDVIFFIVLYSIITIGIGGVNFLVRRDTSVLISIFLTLVPLGVAVLFTSHKKACLNATKYSLIIFQITIIALSFYFGFNDFPNVNPLEKITPNGSYNGITSIIIVMQITYSYLNVIYVNRAPVFTAFLTLVICFIGYGRGSLLVALIIFASSLWYAQSFNTKRMIKINPFVFSFKLKFVFVFAILFFILSNIVFIGDYFVRYTKFGGGAFNSTHRVNMLIDYVDHLNVSTAFFGKDYEDTLIQKGYNGNPHNSFIRAHHYFGLPYLVLLLFLPVYFVIKIFHKPKGILGLLFILCFYLRAYTEIILSPNIIDIYFFLIVFATMDLNKSGSKPGFNSNDFT